MKENAIQLLFGAAVEMGISRQHFRQLRNTLRIIDPDFHQGPIEEYWTKQAGGQADCAEI